MCRFQGNDPRDLSSAERCSCIPGNGDCGTLRALLSHFKPHNLNKLLTFLDSLLSAMKWKEQNVPELECMGSEKYLESRKCFIELPAPSMGFHSNLCVTLLPFRSVETGLGDRAGLRGQGLGHFRQYSPQALKRTFLPGFSITLYNDLSVKVLASPRKHKCTLNYITSS